MVTDLMNGRHLDSLTSISSGIIGLSIRSEHVGVMEPLHGFIQIGVGEPYMAAKGIGIRRMWAVLQAEHDIMPRGIGA